MTIPDLAAHFPGARGYLNTASIGLPPATAAETLHAAIDEWQQGKATAPGYDQAVATARKEFARMVQVPETCVAIGAQVSALVGMVAAGLSSGAQVLCPEGEFTSVLFPFLARPDITVRQVPLEQLAASITADTDLVAFSLVQSADGRLADSTAIIAAARESQTLTLADATQAAGWLPFSAADFDFTVTGTYKWLLSPRGTAFMTVRPEVLDRPAPVYAGWYAGESPWDAIYGAPLRLASDARRFDLSPAWLAWVGTAAALTFINDVGVDAIHSHNLALAHRFTDRLGQPRGESAIVALSLPASVDRAGLDRLATSTRAGRLRVAFHLYNQLEDVDNLAAALGI